jgi:DNA repair protein RecO (recombination protein O)
VKRLQTRGIVLSRTDYGEADRIVTMLTPEQGKLRLMARGVRKPKSKLAGGIELFSTTDISYLPGRGEIGTLISARLIKYYSTIVQDITRVQLGYDLIKMLHRATEDRLEPEYYDLLETAYQALDSKDIGTDLIRSWFEAQLLRYSGHWPNLTTDIEGNKLAPDQTYNFDYDDVAFTKHPEGQFTADHIKLLRLIFSGNPPPILNKVQNLEKLLPAVQPLVRTMLQTYIRL